MKILIFQYIDTCTCMYCTSLLVITTGFNIYIQYKFVALCYWFSRLADQRTNNKNTVVAVINITVTTFSKIWWVNIKKHSNNLWWVTKRIFKSLFRNASIRIPKTIVHLSSSARTVYIQYLTSCIITVHVHVLPITKVHSGTLLLWTALGQIYTGVLISGVNLYYKAQFGVFLIQRCPQ